MNIASFTIILLIILIHIYIAYLEMIAWTTRGPKVFRKFPPQMFQVTKAMAGNQGLYNLFLAGGLTWSLLIQDNIWAIYIAIFFLCCVTVAGIYGAVTVQSSILYIQSIPAILGLIALHL